MLAAMEHPLPVGIASLVVPLLAVTLLVVCTRWLVRSFHPQVRRQRTLLFTGAFLLGLFLVFRFAFHRYQYNADWQMVGVPIPAVYLERTVWPNGKTIWKDWIGVQTPLGSSATSCFGSCCPTHPSPWLLGFCGDASRSPLPAPNSKCDGQEGRKPVADRPGDRTYPAARVHPLRAVPPLDAAG